MRNPERIDKFCDELKTIWHQVPDWRFMQLILNADCEYRARHSYYVDTFYLEDEEFFKFMNEYMEGIKNA